MMAQAFVVSLYAAGERRPSDCYPDFLPTRSAAHEAGKQAIVVYDWVRRYTVRKINLPDSLQQA